jgi:hypothetical protein
VTKAKEQRPAEERIAQALARAEWHDQMAAEAEAAGGWQANMHRNAAHGHRSVASRIMNSESPVGDFIGPGQLATQRGVNNRGLVSLRSEGQLPSPVAVVMVPSRGYRIPIWKRDQGDPSRT